MPSKQLSAAGDEISLRMPDAVDGAAVWSLVQACGPLDENSMYCNMIQCDHFRDTCVIASMGDEAVGWISGHILPAEPDTLFVWQVAVSEKARGSGLARRMLQEILSRDICADVSRIQTTITRDNAASWALFQSFARRQNATLGSEAHYIRDLHFRGNHDTEHMVTIELPDEVRKAA